MKFFWQKKSNKSEQYPEIFSGLRHSKIVEFDGMQIVYQVQPAGQQGNSLLIVTIHISFVGTIVIAVPVKGYVPELGIDNLDLKQYTGAIVQIAISVVDYVNSSFPKAVRDQMLADPVRRPEVEAALGKITNALRVSLGNRAIMFMPSWGYDAGGFVNSLPQEIRENITNRILQQSGGRAAVSEEQKKEEKENSGAEITPFDKNKLN